jgi:cyclophilin family peptidyl-prolyl cis-trans isomerase
MSGGVRIDVGSLGTLSRLAAGGQGVVYETSLKLRQLALPLVYKEYKPQVIGGLDVAALEAMPAYLETLPFADGMELLSLSAWPCRLVEETSGPIRGFVMPAIPPEFFLDIKKASGVARQLGEFQHLLNSDDFLARRQIPLTDRHRYELLAEVAHALSVFHRHGIAVGDLSPKNLLFCIGPVRKVYFIDCDAMRFRGRSVVAQLETPGWEVRLANPAEQLATPESDNYKLGLLALRLLTGDQDTRDPNLLPGSVPTEVRTLIADALNANPAKRPQPDDWRHKLTDAAANASTVPPKPATHTATTNSSIPQRQPSSTGIRPPTPAPAHVNQPAPATPGLPHQQTSAHLPRNRARPLVGPVVTWWQARTRTGKAAVASLALVALAININAFTPDSDPPTASNNPQATSPNEPTDEPADDDAAEPTDDDADETEDDSTTADGAAVTAEGRCGPTPEDVPEVTSEVYDEPFDRTIDPDTTYVATLATTCGDVVIELAADSSPFAVNNFVNLSRDGYYDGVVFHRVIQSFVAQSGDPAGTGCGQEDCTEEGFDPDAPTFPGYSFEDELELAEELYAEVEQEQQTALGADGEEAGLVPGGYPRGTVAMANAGPDTNGSQFFITQGDPTLLPGPLFTVFGTVTEGMEVVDDIVASPTDQLDRPVEDVVIRSVSIEER